jgi:hypothetical protein
MAELRAILASREPLYQLADATVDTSRTDVDAAVAALAESLSNRG